MEADCTEMNYSVNTERHITYGRVVSTTRLVTSAKWLFFEKISRITYWKETGTQAHRPKREEWTGIMQRKREYGLWSVYVLFAGRRKGVVLYCEVWWNKMSDAKNSGQQILEQWTGQSITKYSYTGKMSKANECVGKYKVSLENARTKNMNVVRSRAMAYVVSRHRGGHSSIASL